MRHLIDIVSEQRAFHGTASVFKAFRFAKADRLPSKIGVWFASSPDAATHIAKTVKRMVDDQPRLIEVELHIKNPARFDTYSDFLAAYRDHGSAVKMRRALKRKGFDAIEITHSDTDGAGERTDWAVFDPHQIEIVGSTPVHA